MFEEIISQLEQERNRNPQDKELTVVFSRIINNLRIMTEALNIGDLIKVNDHLERVLAYLLEVAKEERYPNLSQFWSGCAAKLMTIKNNEFSDAKLHNFTNLPLTRNPDVCNELSDFLNNKDLVNLSSSCTFFRYTLLTVLEERAEKTKEIVVSVHPTPHFTFLLMANGDVMAMGKIISSKWFGFSEKIERQMTPMRISNLEQVKQIVVHKECTAFLTKNKKVFIINHKTIHHHRALLLEPKELYDYKDTDKIEVVGNQFMLFSQKGVKFYPSLKQNPLDPCFIDDIDPTHIRKIVHISDGNSMKHYCYLTTDGKVRVSKDFDLDTTELANIEQIVPIKRLTTEELSIYFIAADGSLFEACPFYPINRNKVVQKDEKFTGTVKINTFMGGTYFLLPTGSVLYERSFNTTELSIKCKDMEVYYDRVVQFTQEGNILLTDLGVQATYINLGHLKGLKRVFVSSSTTFFLTEEGKVFVYGSNKFGALGTGDMLTADRLVELQLPNEITLESSCNYAK